MYNIHSHYENILSYLNSIVAQPTVVYLHPFGTTSTDNIESLSNCGDGPIVIAFDQEPLIQHYNQELFAFIKENFKSFRGADRPIILLNTEKHSVEKNKLLDEFKFIDANYFFHGLAAADWYRGYQYYTELTPPTKRTITKKYITFNRITGNSRAYRSFLIGELALRNLLSKGHVSYSEVCPVHGHYEKNVLDTIKTHKISSAYVLKIKNCLNDIDFPLRIDCEGSIPNGSQTIGPIPALMESFLHVVTETCFWDHRTHLTEKIFKPIVAKQPFVLLGCVGNLKYLKSYGFKTFDSWWDESYDSIEDPVERIQAVVKIIEEICNTSDQDLENMLRGMNHILEHNYNLFYSKSFIDSIWNELSTSLQSAISQLPPRILPRTPLR
jgi:hypothetical protein